MFKTFFKTLFKILLALGAVYAVFVVLQLLEERRSEYIEIYNDPEDDEDWEGVLYG